MGENIFSDRTMQTATKRTGCIWTTTEQALLRHPETSGRKIHIHLNLPRELINSEFFPAGDIPHWIM